MNPTKSKGRILAITQCFQCGSWICIEKILRKFHADGYEIIILGLGSLQEKNQNYKYHVIPYIAFNKYGDITCKSPLFNFIWNLPLIFSGTILAAFYRPKFISYNGLASSLIMSPFMRLIGLKNVLMFHSALQNLSGMTKSVLTFLCKFVDVTVVNSRGSRKEMLQIISRNKIVVNEHYVDEVFFQDSPQPEKKSRSFVITYVGRIDTDKKCFPLIRFAESVCNSKKFEFYFAGVGKDFKLVKDLADRCANVHYLGYITSTDVLKELYLKSDVVWSFADVTYLAMPAIEALACGKPLIIPIQAAIMGSTSIVEKKLLPSNIGWFVDENDFVGISKMLIDLAKTGIFPGVSRECKLYAIKHYSIKNLTKTVKFIKSCI